MIFHQRPGIQKQFETVFDFNIKNLIVSGCSFTHNNSMSASVTWPYYLRDLGGFENVLDTSLPGAGNYHISNSLIWALESESTDPKQSLVIVMWSGNDRDDWITPVSNINQYPFEFKYSDNVMSAIAGGGASAEGRVNTKQSHKDFFANVANNLAEDGVILLQEIYHIDEFAEMIDHGKLKIKKMFMVKKHNPLPWYLELTHK